MAPGARSKFGAPMFEPEVFRKQMYCTEVLVTLLGLFGAVLVIRRLGNFAPVVTPLITARINKSWYTALTRGIREPWALGEAKFSNRPSFCATLRKTNRRILQGDGSVSETWLKISGSFS